MRYLLDTNVFYDLANGILDYADLVGSFRGHQFFASPINAIEIVSSEKVFSERQQAAKIFLELCSEGMQILPDSNYELKWQLTSSVVEETGEMENLLQGLRLFTKYTSEQEAEDGIQWGYHTKIYKQKISEIRLERNNTYEGWCNKCQTVKSLILRVFGCSKKLRGKPLKLFRSLVPSLFSYYVVLDNLVIKIQNVLGESIDKPSNLPSSLAPYADIYFTYCLRLFEDDAKPGKNDFGDMEQFIYVSNSIDIFKTSDDLWHRLSNRAGYPNLVEYPV